MGRTKVQVYSEDFPISVALEASMVVSEMVPENTPCFLGRRESTSRGGTGRRSRWRSVRGG